MFIAISVKNQTLTLSWITHPYSIPRIIWNYFLVFLTIYNAFMVPYRTSLSIEDNRVLLTLIIDMVFFCAFLLELVSPYIDKSGNLIISKRQICKSYFKKFKNTNFLIDLANFSPLYLLSSTLYLLKMPRVLIKLGHILRKSHSILLRGITTYSFKIPPSVQFGLYVFRPILFLLVFTHIAACLLVWGLKNLSSGSLDEARGDEQMSPFSVYLDNIYFVVITFSTVGYGSNKDHSVELFAVMLLEVGPLLISHSL